MIGRLLWIALMLALALVTGFAQIDRTARFDAEAAALVPQPFRGFSQQRLAAAAIGAEQGELAVEFARGLIQVRPLPAENLTIFATASFLNDDSEGALNALEAAATRGWRDPVAQFAVADAALIDENYSAAAERLSALWATGEMGDQVGQLATRLSATPEGRMALVQRIALQSHLASGYRQLDFAVANPEVHAELLLTAEAQGLELPCDKLESVAQDFAANGPAEVAERLVPQRCLVE